MAKGLWVVLNVDNVDKSVDFYKMLGLKARRNAEGGMSWGEVLATPDSGLILWSKHEIGPGQDQADLRAWLSGELGKGVLLNFGVPNAQRLWEKVGTMLPVDQPLYEEPWGGRTFALVDPDGYVISLTDKFPSGQKPAKKKAVAKRAKAGVKKAKGAAKKAVGAAKAKKAKVARRK